MKNAIKLVSQGCAKQVLLTIRSLLTPLFFTTIVTPDTSFKVRYLHVMPLATCLSMFRRNRLPNRDTRRSEALSVWSYPLMVWLGCFLWVSELNGQSRFRPPTRYGPRYQVPQNQFPNYQPPQHRRYQYPRYQAFEPASGTQPRTTHSTPVVTPAPPGSGASNRSRINLNQPPHNKPTHNQFPSSPTGDQSAQRRGPAQRRGQPKERAEKLTPHYLRPTYQPKSRFPRIAGDYEKQKAILISVCELLPTHENVFVQLINACQGHVTVGVLVDDRKQLIAATRVLMNQDIEYDHVKFYNLDLDTIWLRDFGPRIGELENGDAVAFDFLYEGTRPLDEKMPRAWSKLTKERYHAVPWTMQGGNLLFNGQGLAVTTNRIFDDNHVRFQNLLPGTNPEVERREMVVTELKKNCNLQQLIVLEPLRNEATRHVDMFAAFVAKDHVLVASLDRTADPVNSALLDRNARKLEKVIVDGKPLKVTRIPTPARQGKFWSTFTNVIFANDLVILPSFDDNPRTYVERAVAVYKAVLPNHKIKLINTTSLKKLEGSVHCMSINVPEFAKLPPKYLSLQKSIAWLKGAPISKQSAPNRVSTQREGFLPKTQRPLAADVQNE